MDTVYCFLDFIEYSFVDYSALQIILQNQDEFYRAFKNYALKQGFSEQTIKDYFYNDIIDYCKEYVMDEKIESVKEDFE